MFDERRRSPRQPALIRATATIGRVRFDVVCTDTSPTGASFTARNPPTIGAEVVVELRAGGGDGPIVNFHGIVTRNSQMGSPGPIGFAVAWQKARCDTGPDPLFWVLRHVMHISVQGDADLTPGRSAEYVFQATADGRPPEEQNSVTPHGTPSSPTRPSSMHQALGVWSPPVHRVGAVTSRESQALEPVRQSAQHPVQLEPQAPVNVPVPRGPSGAPLPHDFDASRNRPSSPLAEKDPSGLFDSLDDGLSVAVGLRSDPSSATRDDSSHSWPVYALAPGERRLVTDPRASAAHVLQRPVQAPTAHHASGVVAQDTLGGRFVRPPAIGNNHPMVAPHVQPSSQPFDPSADRTDPADLVPIRPRKPEGARMLVAADVPITFLRQNQLVPGQLIGIAEQLACVVTQGDAPDLDEVIVIHLPVRVENAWRTVQLTGKLLQVTTDTPTGKRFVLHIERADEGRHKGAFRAFLQALKGP